MLQGILNFDSAVMLYVQSHVRCPVLDAIMVFFSRVGDLGILWIALAVLLILFQRSRRGATAMLVGLGVEVCLCNGLLKHLVDRPRPYLALTELTILVPPEASTSFPSGHAGSSFVCAYLLARAFGWKGALSYIPATLIALSRIYVGVHYPTDVFAGAILGTLSGVICFIFLKKFVRGDKVDGERKKIM